jgi:hypothetical protein
MSKTLRRCAAGLGALILAARALAQVTGEYRSVTTGAWSDVAVWERYNGTTWAPAAAPPASADNLITLQSPHTVTVAAATTADQIVVQPGATLAIAAGITLTLNNGTGTDLSVAGTVVNAGTVGGTGTSAFLAGSVYRHAHTTTAGTVPAAAWDATSTCEFTEYTTNTAAPSGLGQTFGHVTWNAPAQTGAISLGGALLTVAGNLTVTSTGTGALRFGNTSSATGTVSGAFRQTGGIFTLTGATGSPTMNVGGAFELSGGTLRMSEGSGVGTFNLSGDVSITGGTLTETSTGSGAVRFAKSGIQVFTGGGTVQNTINWTVNSGAVLQTGTQILTGGGSFTLSSGGGLVIGSPDGVTSSGAAGNIQVTGSRSFSTGADYTYAGSTAQAAGSGLPATVRNFTLANSAGVTLSAPLTATGAMLLSQGALTHGTFNLSVGGNWTNDGGSLVSSTGTVTFTGASRTIGGAAPTAFPILVIAPGASVTLATPASCTGLSFTAGGTASSLTHAAGVALTVTGNATISQPTAGVTAAWNINGGSAAVSGGVAVGGTNTTSTRISRIVITTGSLTVGGALTFNSAASTAATAVVDMSTGGASGTLTLGGALTLASGTGTLLPGTGSAVVNYSSAAAGQTVVASSAINYRNLHLNSTGAGGATLGAAITASRVTGDLRVQSGTLSTGGFSITGNAGRVFEVGDGAVLRMTGTGGLPAGFGTRSLAPLSTVEYAATGAQTLTAEQYGSLSISGARGAAGVTLEGAGVIRIAGTFLPAATFTTGGYQTTGSTVEFNGAGSQTVPGFPYAGLAVTGSRGAGTITFAPGAPIGVGGVFTPSASFSGGGYVTNGSILEFAGGAQTIPVFPYHHLSLSGAGEKTAGGGLTIAGDLTIGPSALFTAGSFTHTLSGNLANNGTLNGGTGTLELTGGAQQTLSGNPMQFNGLRVASAGVTLAGTDVTVASLLTLQSGRITTGTAAVIIPSGGAVSRSGGHVAGNLRKSVSVGSPAVLFEIGDAVAYTPVSLSFSGVTVPGTLTARTDAGDHPSILTSGIRADRSANRRYALTGDGLLFGSTSATFTFVPADLDPGAMTGAFVVRRFTGVGWSQSPTGTRTATSTQTTGVTGFGEFQVGEGGAAFAGTSLVDAAPASITANGVSASNVTVTLRDDQGVNLTGGGDAVSVTTTRGALGPVTDNGNGTYTAQLTSTLAGPAVIRATVNTGLIADSAVVQLLPGSVSLSVSTIGAQPEAIIANGSTTSVITVQLKDAFGNNLASSGGAVTLTTTRGTLGAVTDSANGRYGALLTSAATIDTAVVTGRLNGVLFTDDARVAFIEGLPTHLAWLRDPRDTVAGALLSGTGGTPAVEVRDASGFRVQNAANTVTVAFAANPGAGTLSGTLTRNAVNGVAVFDNLFITKAAAGYTVQASAAGLTGDTSAAFSILPAASAALAFAQQPTATVTGQIITPAVVVRTVDAFGNPTAAAGVPVSMALTSGTGTLSGTLTVPTDAAGTATFSALAIDSLGSKRLTASATGLTAVQSTAFSITQPPSVLRSDDFNAYDLAPFWTFVNPFGDVGLAMTGTNTPDAGVTMSVPGGISHDASTTGLQAPRIMQAANNTDFEVEGKFLSGVSLRFQLQGIIVEQDSLNFLRFDFNSDGSGTRVFASSVVNGVQTQRASFTVAANGVTPLYMRVRRVGSSWSQFYSFNGIAWNPTGTFTHAITVERVGLFAGNVVSALPAPAHAAVFDYFFNTAAPIVPEDGGTAVDSLPPVITGLSGTVTDSSAAFTWSTTEPSTSSVAYGRTPAYELGTVTDTAVTTAHTVMLTGLSPQTLYYFRAASTDLRNNTGYGPDSTFATPDSSIILSDDFNTYALKPQWTFVDPRSDAGLVFTGQNTTDAWARITVPAGAVHQPWTGGNTAPRLMQPANDRDFGLEVKFESPLTQAFQMQGLLVEQDSLNYLRFDVNSDGTGTKLFAGSVSGGTGTSLLNVAAGANGAAPQYLRILRSGNLWTFLSSLDGSTWTQAGTATRTLGVTRTGVYAGNAGTSAPAHTASIDYFFNMSSPLAPEDGGTAGGNTPPEISGLSFTPTGTTVTVAWTTNEPATGIVRFGPTAAYGGTAGDSIFRVNHAVTVRALEPGSAVHLQVRAADIYGDSTITADTVVETGPASTIRSDDFNLFLLDTLVWRRVNPRGDGTLTMANTNTDSARVFLAVPGGISHEPWSGGNTAHRIMQGANNADFEVEVKFESPLTARFQIQGIIAEQGPAEYIRFDLNSDGTVTKAFAATISGGVPTSRFNVTVGTNGAAPQYLRVKREGDLWTQSTSFDGLAWTVAGSFTHALTMDSIGVFAGNTGTTIPAHTAKVDYFFNTRTPVVPEDGGIAPDPFPPVLSALTATPAATSALIAWTTNERATSSVSWGLTPAYELGTITDTARTTAHSVTLPGLSPVTAYRFRVSSTDSSGNTATSPDSGFTTLSASTFVSDDFNEPPLNGFWTFLNPLGDGAVTLAHPHTDSARAVITVPGGTAHDIWSTGRNAPRIMQSVNNVDMELEVKFESQLTQRFQIQGFLIEQDAGQFVRFDVNSDGSVTKAFAATFVAGAPTTRFNVSVGTNGAAPQWLRIRRQGNTWTCRTSFNGVTWATAGTFTFAMNVTSAGVFAGNSGTTPPPQSALVDYVFNTSFPIVPEDPIPDLSAPVISGVAAVPETTSVGFSWTTNEPATGSLQYGLTPLLELGSWADTITATAHAVTIAGLTPGTLYYYRIQAVDTAANTALSPVLQVTTTKPWVQAPIRAFLEGPYAAAGDSLRTDLRSSGLLPLLQPYGAAPWNYTQGLEAVDSIPPGVVDWVLAELRSAADSTLTVSRRAGFLLSSGSVVDTDGVSPLKMYGVQPGVYRVVLRHRNHLPVMSAAPVPLALASGLTDFTASLASAFGEAPMRELESGVFGLRGGDGNADGGVDVLDRNLVWRPQNGTAWSYTKLADFNLDGGIDALDLNLHWRPNNGFGTDIPGAAPPDEGDSSR